MTIRTINAPIYTSVTLAAKFSGVSITSYGSIAAGYGAPAAYYSGYGGNGGTALTLPKGGTVINNGGLQGGVGAYGSAANPAVYAVDGGAGGAGGAGLFLAADGQVTNGTAAGFGIIYGGAGAYGGAGSPGATYPSGATAPGGDGGRGGDGGVGVELEGGGKLTNFNTIAGGAGGNGAAPGNYYAFFGAGGRGGAGVVLDKAGQVTNFGSITGGAGGVGGELGSRSGYGYYAPHGMGVVIDAGGTVTNGSASYYPDALIAGYDGVYVAGAGTVVNFGTIQGVGGDSVELTSAADRLIAEAGSVFIRQIGGGGGTLELAGGNGEISGLGGAGRLSGASTGKFSGFGAYVIDAGAAWTLTGANALGSDQSLTVAGALKVNAAGDVFSGHLAGAGTVTFATGSDTLSGAKLSVANLTVYGGVVTLSGTIANSGTVTVDGGNVVVAAGGSKLTGAGRLVLASGSAKGITGADGSATLTNGSQIVGAGNLGDGEMSLVNLADGAIEALGDGALVIDTGAVAIANAGLIEAAGGALTIASAVNNTGKLSAATSNLTVNGAVAGSGVGVVGKGVLDFTTSFTEDVIFASGATGTLELAKSQTYVGTISGFSQSGATGLDLSDIQFKRGTTKASFVGTIGGGTLTVTDGVHTAKIALTGNYTGVTFVVASDGYGGTTIRDAAKGAKVSAAGETEAVPHPAQAFIQSMAGIGASGAAAVGGAGEPCLGKPTVLASPGVHIA